MVQLRFLKDNGENHRGTLAVSEMDNLESYIQQCADSVGEEADLSKCDEIRALAAVELPEDSELARIDFKCGPESVTAEGKYTYPDDCFTLQAKTKDKRVKGDGQAIATTFCHKCNETGDWKQTDVNSCIHLPQEFKDCHNALAEIKDGQYVETYRLLNIEDEPDYPETETVEYVEQEVELINGIPTLKSVTKTKEVPLFDEVPIVDEEGNPVMEIDTPAVEAVEAKEAVLDEEGNVIEEAVEAVEAVEATYKQRTYQVPRMIKGKKVSDEEKARLAELICWS